MFFVRVILFFMSRKADEAHVPTLAVRSEAVRSVAAWPDRKPSLGYQGVVSKQTFNESYNEDPVTREEMTKLFGSALSVR